jgi:hypothetical protein
MLIAAPKIQLCASHVLTGIEAISAPNGGSARGYQGLPAPLAIPAAAIQTAAKSYFYASPALA